jgi:hypothetical protein
MIAQDMDFVNWTCVCSESGGTSGACPICAWGDLVHWCCGGVECHEEDCDLDENIHEEWGIEELQNAGLL